jgi:hypothetical protein
LPGSDFFRREAAARGIFMAKIFDNLYQRLTNFANLYEAWCKAARAKRECPFAVPV